jgi:two-component system LytT family response regulator
MKIRTLIVDDEPLARQRLRRLLEADPDIAVLGESGDGARAVADLRELNPDLVFLDVQMPVLDGFGVLQALTDSLAGNGQTPASNHILPVVIFVTAHDRYALKAFEVHAFDYLLKPFDKARFAAALERAKVQVRQGNAAALHERLHEMLQTAAARRSGPERLMVKSGARISFIKTADIDWIEAAGNYVRLHVGKEDHLLREALSALEKKLDPARFVRVHRSSIVNLDSIRELQPVFHGDYVIILRDGAELPLSRSCRAKLEEALGQRL